MTNSKYYKGFDENYQRAIFEVFNEPKEKDFGMYECSEGSTTYQVIMTNLDSRKIMRYESPEYAIKKGCWISKEISESEYTIYKNIQVILDEMWNNQWTGGFPRTDVIDTTYRQLSRQIKDYEKEQNGEKPLPYNPGTDCFYGELSNHVHREEWSRETAVKFKKKFHKKEDGWF